MMGIRQKLSLGFGGLLLIMMVIGIQGILHLSRLGESIDVILRENYRSVIACQEMKEALERIDSGILFTLLGDTEKGKELISKNLIVFEKALQTELNNITVPGEDEKAALLQEIFKQYKKGLESIEDRSTPPVFRRNVYFRDLLPAFQQIKDKADEILHMNQQNMSDANNHARKDAANARRQMYILLFVGIITASGFVYFTGRWILRPINRLIKSTNEIGRGNLDLIVQSSSHDEIGYLSESFNAMTANLREFRRSDQARLVRIQQATQQAFNSLPDAIAVIDFDGRIELATASARDIFGLKPDIRMQDIQFPLILDIFKGALKSGHITVPENGKTIIQQFVKGEERFFRPEAIPIKDAKGQPTGVMLALKDVTQLRQQDELKKGIISTVSHQLKTPLTSIRMAIHLLLEENESPGHLTDKQVELLLVAREDSDRLNDILSSLLDISRMESGKVTMHFQTISPNTIVLDAVDIYTLSAHDRGIELRTELSHDLPEVWADPMQINQVFSNLLGNALRYTNPGGIITVSASADNRWVFFKVSDTGRGIPAEYLDRLFEQFFRVPKQKKETGAGLGLAIVKEIVEAHGGTIRAESHEGKGSTFTFTLKRTDQISKKEHHS
ncbi:MAG: ATP-binding protein [Proteobacteria bacterium]|nr:ATP-binding protein [Pseudomonadota bacterium]